eukprot:Awhi_evm2s13269
MLNRCKKLGSWLTQQKKGEKKNTLVKKVENEEIREKPVSFILLSNGNDKVMEFTRIAYDQRIERYWQRIQTSIVSAMHQILQTMSIHENQTLHKLVNSLSSNLRQPMENSIFLLLKKNADQIELSPEMVICVEELWNLEDIKRTFAVLADKNLIDDLMAYYFEHVTRISRSLSHLEDEDIINCDLFPFKSSGSNIVKTEISDQLSFRSQPTQTIEVRYVKPEERYTQSRLSLYEKFQSLPDDPRCDNPF